MPDEGTDQILADAATQADGGDAPNPETASTETTPDDQMRAIYDTLAGPGTQDGDEPGEPAPDAPTEEGEETAATGDVAKDQPKDEAKAIEPERLDKARNALKRWKYPDDVLSGLTDERLLELGESAIAQQAEQDRIGNQKRDLARMLEQIEAERAAKQANPDDGKAKAEPNKDAKQEAKPTTIEAVIEALRNDELHADLADPLSSVLTMLQQQHEAKLSEATKALEAKVQQIDRLYQELDRVELGMARRELIDELPQLKDPAKYQAVSKRVFQLAQLPGYTDESGNPDTVRLMRDAAQLEFGNELKQQLQADLAERYKKQSDGQPTATTKNRVPAAGLDPDAKMKLALQRLTQGKKVEDIQQELASASAG